MAEKAEHTGSNKFWETPRSGKIKNKSKKDKPIKNGKTHRTKVTRPGLEEKDKNKKSKRNKRKTKNKGTLLTLNLEDYSFSSIISCASNCSKPQRGEYSLQNQEHVPLVSDSVKAPKKKAKKKKKVAFDSSPDYISEDKPSKHFTSTNKDKAKHTLSWERLESDNDIITSSTYQWVEREESTEHREGPDNSQSSAEEANSDDLFITQKKFRISPPSDRSSSEGTGEGVATTVPRISNSLLQPKEEPLFLTRSETATQTDNFFTSEISTFLRFHRLCESAECAEQATDLSLPNRTRARLGPLSPSSPLQVNGEEMVPTFGQMSTDTSNEENDQWFHCKSQVKAVQMRLNESFFFKMKGEGQSPRPQSPLMKFTQSHDENTLKKKMLKKCPKLPQKK